MNNPVTKILYHLLLVAVSVGAYACGSDSATPDPDIKDVVITVSPEAISVPNDATAEKLSITATADWSLNSDSEWCKVFPSGGLKNTATEVTVNISANSGADAREAVITVTSGSTQKHIVVSQASSPVIELGSTTVCFGAQNATASVNVKSNVAWTAAVTTASWLSVAPAQGSAGTSALTLTCEANDSESDREAVVTVSSEKVSAQIKVIQYSDVINTPEGYTLVWNDEFNLPDGSAPDLSKWYYDEWAPGFVNNELQRYVAGALGNDKTAEINGGVLQITARKSGSQVISARLNTKEMWQYGYFEARLKLPKGKGTWPAYWMMPADGGNWPHCGEIDIMEEVGTNPNYTSSSIHCTAYNHTIGTQKTAERLTPGAEDEFHIYALEWTPDFIRTYIDGKLLFSFENDKKGDQNTWPFDKPFHPIINLAWGGDWGGMNGVDESALPATYEIDYLRVFQKL